MNRDKNSIPFIPSTACTLSQQNIMVSIFVRVTSLIRAVSYLIGMGLIFLIIMIGLGINILSNINSIHLGFLIVGIPVAFFVIATLSIIFYIGTKVCDFQGEILQRQEDFASSYDKLTEKADNGKFENKNGDDSH